MGLRLVTGTDRVLAELRTGPKTAAELYATTYTVVHSRISDLRRRGYTITIERTGGQGAASFVYHLGAEPVLTAGSVTDGELSGRHVARESAPKQLSFEVFA